MPDATVSIDEVIERYELARQRDIQPNVADHLPPESHPDFSAIAIELFRVDLEYRFNNGTAPDVDDYMRRFPLVFESEQDVQELAFEHFRLRCHAGDRVDPEEYSSRYNIDTSTWHRKISTTQTQAATIRAIDDPQLIPGFRFENFTLQEELGRGALARVFLARQSGIANREVVLKFTACRTVEVERLGRLQHENIVPVYSVHEYTAGSAICMPMLGKQTLADLLSDEQARRPSVMQLATDLARGLQHAHARGVLHRDIKPANILVADDGRAMLLDFNLADDLNEERQTIIGGTVHYMSPEQKLALRSVSQPNRPDQRADIFSVGTVLFEFVTGKLFSGTSDPNAALAKTLSPAMCAIVTKCLRFEPQHRYHSAGDLLQDLKCQEEHQPLRHQPEPSLKERAAKWARRHPRLSSGATLCSVFAVLFAIGAVAWTVKARNFERIEAVQKFQTFQTEMTEVRSLLALTDTENDAVAEGITRGETLLHALAGTGDSEAFVALQNLPPNARTALKRTVGELLYYLSEATTRASHWEGNDNRREDMAERSLEFNRQAVDWFEGRMGSVPRAVSLQRDRLTGSKSVPADQDIEDSPLDQLLMAIEFNQSRQFDRTIEYLDGIKSDFASDVSFWNLMGSAHAGQKRFAEADACFTTCIAFKPDSWIAWSNRGLARMALGRFEQAEGDFSEVIDIRPKHWSGYLNRALAKGRQRDFPAAIEDLLKAEDLGGPTRIYFLRARYRAADGDRAGAIADHRAGLAAVPSDEKSWVSRGIAKLAKTPEAALADFQEAIRLNPNSLDGLRNVAHVLSERMKKPQQAIDALTKIIDAGVKDSDAFAGRAVLYARAQQTEPAIADAARSLELADTGMAHYQAACVYGLLCAVDKQHEARALARLATAFEKQPSLVKFSTKDPDLRLVVSTDAYRDLVNASQTISRLKHQRQKSE